mgnify:CR=1 FL=1
MISELASCRTELSAHPNCAGDPLRTWNPEKNPGLPKPPTNPTSVLIVSMVYIHTHSCLVEATAGGGKKKSMEGRERCLPSMSEIWGSNKNFTNQEEMTLKLRKKNVQDGGETEN